MTPELGELVMAALGVVGGFLSYFGGKRRQRGQISKDPSNSYVAPHHRHR